MQNPFSQFAGWWKKTVGLHGIWIVLLTIFVYSGQGGRGYVDNTLDYVGQYQLNLTAAEMTGVKATGKLPWSLKFLIGLVSDNLPIMGYNVKPYMMLFCLLGLGSLITLGLDAFSNTAPSLTIAYVIMQFYGAGADCMADSLVVKNGRNDEEDASSGLQSLSWFSLGLGGAIFTILGSQLSTDFSGANDGVSVAGTRIFCLIMTIYPIGLFIFMCLIHEDKAPFTPGIKALGQQLVRVFAAVFAPPFLILRVAFWIFISGVAHISLASASIPYTIGELNITPDVSGYIDVTSYLFLSVGVVVYYRFFRYTSFRTIFIV